MPASKNDVTAVLIDPALARINFTVADIPVNAPEFMAVSGYIVNDDITVVTGPTAGMAFYDRRNNQLETDPASQAPLSLGNNALLLHECVHAIVDIRQLKELSLTDEVAAYIAQLTYMQIKSPSPAHVPAVAVPRNRPLALFVSTVLDVIDQYKLTSKAGLGARISQFDIFILSERLRAVAQYSAIKPDDWDNPQTSGVPVKGGGIRTLREAIRVARHPPRSSGLLSWPVTNRDIF